MTNTRNSAIIRAELAETALAYNRAREDAIMFERLKAAAAKAAQLSKRDDELRVELLATEEAETNARREAAYANIRNMRVDTIKGGIESSSPLAPQYIIRFERITYNSSIRRSDWAPVELNGFGALSPEQFGYLIEKAPEQIPAGIMALAPGNPLEAFRIYSLGMSRGYLSA